MEVYGPVLLTMGLGVIGWRVRRAIAGRDEDRRRLSAVELAVARIEGILSTVFPHVAERVAEKVAEENP